MTRFASIVRNDGIGRLLGAVFVAIVAVSTTGRVEAAQASVPTHELTKVASMAPDRKPPGVPDDYVITPNGYFSPTCVAIVHAGDKLKANGLIQRASGIAEKPQACGKPNFTLQGVRVEANGQRATLSNAGTNPEKTGWVQAASYTNSTPVGRIVASWAVPSNPTNHSNQTIYFFPGLEQLPNVQSILQPVLGWNGYGDNAWTLASWNCCVDGTTFHSDPIAANAGDEVVGDTYSTCAAGQACSTWKIDSRNTTTGQTSSLTTDPYADLTWVFAGVLEVYNVSTCDEYPGGPITFHDVQVYDRNNNLVANPPWSGADTSGIDPQCNYGLSTTPTSATIAY